MTLKEDYRKFFKGLGYKTNYNQRIISYIDYNFDVFLKDDEELAVYLVEKNDLLSSLFDIAKMIALPKPNIKMCLILPSNILIPAESFLKALESNVDLYIIKEGHVFPALNIDEKKIIDKLKIQDIGNTLQNINRICNSKWEYKIFKIKRSLLNRLNTEIGNEENFIYQITTIGSIIDSVDHDAIGIALGSLSRQEKESFSKGSISQIELFLKKKNISYDLSLISTMRNLKDLRNIQPVHPSERSKGLRVCKKFLGKIPKENTEWIELHRIVFNKFSGCLTLLRDTLK